MEEGKAAAGSQMEKKGQKCETFSKTLARRKARNKPDQKEFKDSVAVESNCFLTPFYRFSKNLYEQLYKKEIYKFNFKSSICNFEFWQVLLLEFKLSIT